jgi:hypothetical protein
VPLPTIEAIPRAGFVRTSRGLLARVGGDTTSGTANVGSVLVPIDPSGGLGAPTADAALAPTPLPSIGPDSMQLAAWGDDVALLFEAGRPADGPARLELHVVRSTGAQAPCATPACPVVLDIPAAPPGGRWARAVAADDRSLLLLVGAGERIDVHRVTTDGVVERLAPLVAPTSATLQGNVARRFVEPPVVRRGPGGLVLFGASNDDGARRASRAWFARLARDGTIDGAIELGTARLPPDACAGERCIALEVRGDVLLAHALGADLVPIAASEIDRLPEETPGRCPGGACSAGAYGGGADSAGAAALLAGVALVGAHGRRRSRR